MKKQKGYVMKRKWTVILTVIALFVFLVPSITFAQEIQDNQKIFNQEQVDKLKMIIDKKELSPDKTADSQTGLSGQLNSGLSSTKSYPTRKGVILVTADAYKGLIPTGHAAIVYSPNRVVESLSRGVTIGNNNWYSSKKTCYGVTVRKSTGIQDKTAADWCYKQIGKPYNWNYLNTGTRDSFYCSQLVWASFLDNFNIDLNTSEFLGAIHPMELVSTDKTIIVYRK